MVEGQLKKLLTDREWVVDECSWYNLKVHDINDVIPCLTDKINTLICNKCDEPVYIDSSMVYCQKKCTNFSVSTYINSTNLSNILKPLETKSFLVIADKGLLHTNIQSNMITVGYNNLLTFDALAEMEIVVENDMLLFKETETTTNRTPAIVWKSRIDKQYIAVVHYTLREIQVCIRNKFKDKSISENEYFDFNNRTFVYGLQNNIKKEFTKLQATRTRHITPPKDIK